MTRGLAFLLLVPALATVATCAAAEPDPSGLRLITVTGNAEVRVAPDRVRLSVGVETVDVELASAKAANDARVADIFAAAEAHGVESEDVRTDFLLIEPRFKDRQTRTELAAYTVGKKIVIDFREISRFESLLSAVLEAGANHVYGVDFRTSDLRAHRDRARALAVIAAKEKAAAMAGQLGQRVGRPHSIREGTVGSMHRSPGLANVAQSGGFLPDSVEGVTPAGRIAIEAAVTVNFEMIDAG